MIGRLLAAACAGLVAFVFVSGLGAAGFASTGSAAGGLASTGCAHPCDGSSPTIAPAGHSVPDPCIRDAGCGGGAALVTGIAVAAMLGVTADVAALARSGWRGARFLAAARVGRVLSGGLFRPPRVLFDV